MNFNWCLGMFMMPLTIFTNSDLDTLTLLSLRTKPMKTSFWKVLILHVFSATAVQEWLMDSALA